MILDSILYFSPENGLGEGIEDADKNHSIAKLLGKRKQLGSIPPAISKQSSPNSTIPLPHLVYKIDFLENDVEKQSVWMGKTTDDILENIIVGVEKKSSEKKESKVIVVLELPSGGEVTKFCIGDTENELEVQIRKHSLMLHPQALLFSGIEAGFLDAIKMALTLLGAASDSMSVQRL